ncbi:16S rRNA (cytosine(1402)-N(4))-methyltransferase RsmH [Patescibacteria group bacterium]|nr:16S rRNA (cytosine(1402)-N(4))-methyltransferase RsmH [Patescibacteria group bacterium]
MPSHIPVLATEVAELLQLKPGDVVVDATLGAGGHSSAILEKISPKGTLVGIDKDEDAIRIASNNLSSFKPQSQLATVVGSYTALDSIFSTATKSWRCGKPDGILFDLGLSSLQLGGNRGFSFLEDAPLDMRFGEAEDLTAEIIINSYPVDKLADILWQFGEERDSRKIAKAIFEARRKERITTTNELVDIVTKAKGGRKGRINPATLTFQALRIAVNDELSAIMSALPIAIELLKPGGRLAVISYHSLEDRIVKNIFRDAAKNEIVKLVTKKPTRPSFVETKNNPRSRSAKLRVIEKI